MPHPFVKWSYEPPRAEDVPLALARATHLATLPPKGPVFVSIPMDDWDAEVDDGDVAEAIKRTTDGRTAARTRGIGELARRLEAAKNPVMVAGPDIDASGGWDAASPSPSARTCRCGRRPPQAAGGSASRRAIRTFAGMLPPAVGPVGETLKGHDLILVVGSSVFPYYPNIPGPLLPEGAELVAITSDPDEAARAPMGDAIVADVGLTLALARARSARPTATRRRVAARADRGPESDPLSGTTVDATLAEVSCPTTGSSCSSRPRARCALRNQLRLSRPGCYYFGAGGGLGFGLVGRGRRPARPARPPGRVRRRRGLGPVRGQRLLDARPPTTSRSRSSCCATTSTRSSSGSSAIESVTGAPGLDLPALDCAAIAAGYGVDSHQGRGRDELHEALAAAIASDAPQLIEVRVAPGMSLF